jgi:hypothetical protein
LVQGVLLGGREHACGTYPLEGCLRLIKAAFDGHGVTSARDLLFSQSQDGLEEVVV